MTTRAERQAELQTRPNEAPASTAVTNFPAVQQVALASPGDLPAGASTEAKQDAIVAAIAEGLVGIVERLAVNVLRRLNFDNLGRLRVGDVTLASSQTLGTVSTVSTVSAVSSITSWGVMSATARSQVDGHQAFQQGFRRNLIVS